MISWALPTSAIIGGREYRINTDYRDILDIIEHLQYTDSTEQERIYIALALFYEEFNEMPETEYSAAIQYLFLFINCGQEETDTRSQPKQIDWEQDQLMIVADMNKVSGCEIRSLPFLHWWTFIAYFNGIGDGQLATVVGIRTKLRRGKKLEKWEQEFYRDNKTKIDLKKKYSAEELEEMDRIKKLLGE